MAHVERFQASERWVVWTSKMQYSCILMWGLFNSMINPVNTAVGQLVLLNLQTKKVPIISFGFLDSALIY